MKRNLTYRALTLRTKAIGESNREAWFLTEEEGVLRATVFGGAKSRLRSQVAPFHEGELWLYHDPVRDSRKVSDFDVRSYRIGIRDLYERTLAAHALAETVLASHGGGGAWQDAVALCSQTLDTLSEADAQLCSRLGIYFLWHWAAHLGVRPDLSTCASCSCALPSEMTVFFSLESEAVLCGNCAKLSGIATLGTEGNAPLLHRNNGIRIQSGARMWLRAIEECRHPPSSALPWTQSRWIRRGFFPRRLLRVR